MKQIIIALIMAFVITIMRILQGSLGSYDDGFLNSGLDNFEVFFIFIKFFLAFVFIVNYTVEKGFNNLKPIIIVFSIPSFLIGFIVFSDIDRYPYDNSFFIVLNYMISTWLLSMIFGYVLHFLYNIFVKIIWGNKNDENI